MSLQYISDNSGNHTAVIIPIEKWNNITVLHEDLKVLETATKIKQKRNPTNFQGSFPKEVALQMISDIESSRNGWERDI